MPHLILGLGNPGEAYARNRHNVGFLCLDAFIEQQLKTSLSWSKKFKSLFSQSSHAGDKLYFLKPQTYMNLSGEALQEAQHFFKLDLDQILVIQDDLDLAFGRLKWVNDSGSGGHNGIKSIHKCLTSQKIPRLKIGIGKGHPGQSTESHVLSNFNQEESQMLQQIFQQCGQGIDHYLKNGLVSTQNLFNS